VQPDPTRQPELADDPSPAMHAQSAMTFDDCLEFVWRLARDGGLSTTQAADVCLMTLLRLSDKHVGRNGEALPTEVTRWVLRTAVEECRTSRRLATWRRPRLINLELETAEVRA
jgi:hypothetical protein